MRAGIAAGTAQAFDPEARQVTVALRGEVVRAEVSEALDPAVIRTALSSGEPLILQEEDSGWVVLGALRTAATPGVDEAPVFVIRAGEVRIEAEDRLALVAGAAQLVLTSARGAVSAVARTITARASETLRLLGRAVHLN